MNLELPFEILLNAIMLPPVEMTLIIISTCAEATVGLTLRETS
jgi:hypothetical protein